MQEFEDKVLKLIRNIKFHREFQEKLKEDVALIKAELFLFSFFAEMTEVKDYNKL